MTVKSVKIIKSGYAWCALLLVGPITAQASESDNVPSVIENGAIIRRNGNYFNNRPLYASSEAPVAPYYYVLTGDRPLLRFGGPPWIDGHFVLGFQKKGGESKWLQDFKAVEFRYYGGRVEWVASDPAFPGITVSLQALPLAVGSGLAAQAKVTGATNGDGLIWMFGAAYREDHVARIDALVTPGPRSMGFTANQAQGNRVEVKDGVIRVEPPRGDNLRYTLATCNTPSEIRITDASQWKTPGTLQAGTAGSCPVAYGVTPIAGDKPIIWSARCRPATDKAAVASNPETDFRIAMERVEKLNTRVVSQTPDARFDFMVRAVSHSMDGVWRGTTYAHGGSGPYPMPFLGWRTVIGGMAYGWHERVLKSARHFFASQVTGESYRDQPVLRARVDGNKELAVYERTMTHPGANPLYLSKGRLIPDQMSTMYDMQSIFFDQVVEAWRFTADPELEKILRPALELHLGYLGRAFDPDGNGAYESFINTYLTDNQWYNGGDTAEETAFAYRGHLAARDMARRAGDSEAIKRHDAKLALIRKGFFESVWVKRAGHPGAYREQGGLRRLHPDAWLPAIVHSMDCSGLYNEEQMASVLHFTEYGLQRDKQPLGGVRVWPSNWVPGVWSLRTKSPGEEHHLALAYCQAGMPEAAMEVTRGCHSETGFQSPVPANFGEPWTGVDFTDFMAPFARTVVSGFFGYRPDRPNGLVTLAPQFPADWDHASLAHPEFKLAYKRQGTTQRLSIELQRESALDVQLPFCGRAVKAATLNGQPIQGSIKPGFGRSVFVVRTPVTQKAELELTVDQELPMGVAQSREVESGTEVELAVEGGRITEVRDEQGVLESIRLAEGKAQARVSVNAGNHRLLALVQMGQATQWRIFDFQVRDHKAEAYTAEKNLRQAPAGAVWTGIDLASIFNSRVTELFRQDYVSPRPDTMSARIGRDAYLTWHGAYCRKPSPAVDLSNTWPRRPAPVYDVTLGDLKLGGDFTLETWVRADLAAWVNGRILEWGDLVLETSPGSRVVGLYAGKKLIWNYPVLCAERTTHIAAVFRGGRQVALYLNGETRDKVPQPIDVSELSLGSTLRVGADRNGQRRLLGLVERVAISRQAVTVEQLKGRSLESASLPGAVADWRVTEAAEAQIASGVPGLPSLVRQNVAFKASKELPDPVTVSDGKLETPQGARFLWKNGEVAFTSLWDNWPRKVSVTVNQKGGSVWLLVVGSTNPMQVRIANAVLRFEYADGATENLELVPPMNFWSLCEFGMSKDYDYKTEAFSLPKEPPPQVQLGNNCRAMVYGWKLRPGLALKSVTLESLSQEVVIGLMGVSICNP